MFLTCLTMSVLFLLQIIVTISMIVNRFFVPKSGAKLLPLKILTKFFSNFFSRKI